MAAGGRARRQPGGDPEALDQPGGAPPGHCHVRRAHRSSRRIHRKECSAAGGCNVSLSQQWLTWRPQQEVTHKKFDWTCGKFQERRWDIKVLLDTGASAWVTRDGPAVTTLSLEGAEEPLVVGGAGYYRCPAVPHPAQGQLWPRLVGRDC